MKIDIRDIRTQWINLEKDTTKAEQMVTLLNERGFKNHERFAAMCEDTEFGITKDNCNPPGTPCPSNGMSIGLDHGGDLLGLQCPGFGTHMCGLSHRKLLNETIVSDGKPIFVLEDDVEIENDNIKYEIEIPDDVDAVYLGTSQGDCNYSAISVNEDIAKVQRIFATHAIIHFNPEYSKRVIQLTEDAVKGDGPFDVGIAYSIQKDFNVYAVKTPYFYQADSKNTVNKYEYITRIPLLLNDEESNLV